MIIYKEYPNSNDGYDYVLIYDWDRLKDRSKFASIVNRFHQMGFDENNYMINEPWTMILLKKKEDAALAYLGLSDG